MLTPHLHATFFHKLTLKGSFITIHGVVLVASVDQDQAAQNVQSDL